MLTTVVIVSSILVPSPYGRNFRRVGMRRETVRVPTLNRTDPPALSGLPLKAEALGSPHSRERPPGPPYRPTP